MSLSKQSPSTSPKQSVQIPPAPKSKAPRIQGTPQLKIAHILFMDMVGYSRMGMESQAAVQIELQNLVQRTEAVRQAQSSDTLVCRPTGDGMALLFFDNPLSPVNCALQLDKLLRDEEEEIIFRTKARIQLRMGLHTGSVLMVVDVNGLSDVAGEGIVMAQRVMDCGDAGHILLSHEMAQMLRPISPWHRYIHDMGTCRVKHGTVVHLFNLQGSQDGTLHGSFHGQAFGSARIPRKVSCEAAERVEKAMQAPEEPRFFSWQPFLNFLSMLLCAFAATAILVILWGKSPEFRTALTEAGTEIQVFFCGKKIHKQVLPGKNKAKTTGTGTGTGTASHYPDINRTEPVFPVTHTATAEKIKKRTLKAPSVPTFVAEPDSDTKIRVPNFIGMEFDQAVAYAKGLGITLECSDKSTFTIQAEKGVVYSQKYPEGTYIKDSTPFFVRVSKGPLRLPEMKTERMKPIRGDNDKLIVSENKSEDNSGASSGNASRQEEVKSDPPGN